MYETYPGPLGSARSTIYIVGSKKKSQSVSFYVSRYAYIYAYNSGRSTSYSYACMYDKMTEFDFVPAKKIRVLRMVRGYCSTLYSYTYIYIHSNRYIIYYI